MPASPGAQEASTNGIGPARRRALLSVADKTGLVEFAAGLVGCGFELVASGGTAAALRAEAIQVIDVSELTGYPEMLEGRVKTLHPVIHAGILARRERQSDLADLERRNISLIDLVVVNLYRFAEAVSNPDSTRAGIVEKIDIGGSTLIRSAAKNSSDVGVVIDPADYSEVLSELRDLGGSLSEATRSELTLKAFAHTAAYDAAIARWLLDSDSQASTTSHLVVSLPLESVLRYGENPHQEAALYGDIGAGRLTLVHGAELSYNNLLDVTAGVALVGDVSSPEHATVAIIKHNTPCGVANAQTPVAAFRAAFATDRLSPFGGVVVTDRAIDLDLAEAIDEVFTEVVAGPSFSDPALEFLSSKQRRRLLIINQLVGADVPEVRSVTGGLLVQARDSSVEEIAACEVVTHVAPTDEQLADLDFAWRVVKHIKSNSVVFARDRRTLAIGGGMTARVDAVHAAIAKAGREGVPLAGSVVASDGFFPFPDSVELLAEAGAVAVVQPGGSSRDAEVTSAADRLGVAVVHTGRRHFRH